MTNQRRQHPDDYDPIKMGKLFCEDGEPLSYQDFLDMLSENMPYVPLIKIDETPTLPKLSDTVKEFLRLFFSRPRHPREVKI